MSSSDHIALVPFSVCLNFSLNDEPVNFACLDENRTWQEVDWGENNLFPKEIQGWILTKSPKELTGIRDGYNPFYWEYTKKDKVVGWMDNGEDDEYFIFSDDRDSLICFLTDYTLPTNIRANSEVNIYY